MIEYYGMSSDQNPKFVYAKMIVEGNAYAKVECPVCHKETKAPPSIYNLTATLSKGSIFPDMLCFAPASWMKVISEKALTVFKENNVAGFIPHKLKIVDSKKNPLSGLNYYILEIIGYANIDYDKMGTRVTEYCKCCGYRKFENWENVHEQNWLIEDTWDGSDIFTVNLCTRKVLQVVYENQLTGFSFKHGIDTGNALKQYEINLKELFGRVQ